MEGVEGEEVIGVMEGVGVKEVIEVKEVKDICLF